MIDLKWCIEFAVLFSELVLGIVGFVTIYSFGDLSKWLKHFYTLSITLLLLLAGLGMAEKLAGLNEIAWFEKWFRVFVQLIRVPLFAVLITYMLYCSGEEFRGSKIVRINFILHALILVEDFFLVAFGYDTDIIKNIPLFVAILIIGLSAFAFDTFIFIKRWGKLTPFQRLFFVLNYFSVQFLMLFIMELFILHDRNERYRKQKEELALSRTKVAVLQMRPHFIYNTLINIYYLCRDDSERAQRVILDFTKYLQNNFTAIASEESIPFIKELEHTRAYLNVVSARYENRLFVEYDTPVTMFSLPPLTLQPIVENAVKYGMSPELEPLYISILTDSDEGTIRLTVDDTGPGFRPESDNEPHTALRNIRERLALMCGGTLEISPRESGGTRVTICIPNQHSAIENKKRKGTAA